MSFVADIVLKRAALTVEGVARELQRRQDVVRVPGNRELAVVFRQCVEKVPDASVDDYLQGFFSRVLLPAPPEYGEAEVWLQWSVYQSYLYEHIPRGALSYFPHTHFPTPSTHRDPELSARSASGDVDADVKVDDVEADADVKDWVAETCRILFVLTPETLGDRPLGVKQ
jgi:hypothetical protein